MKILQKTYIIFAILVCCSYLLSHSQEIEAHDDQITDKLAHLDGHGKRLLKKYQQDYLVSTVAKNSSSKKQSFRVPVKAHAVRDTDGRGGLSTSSIESALEDLNNIFKDVNVQFYLFNGVEFIDDSNLNEIRKGDEGALINDYYREGVLNIYFTDKILNISDLSICGYNIDNLDKNIIILKNSCAVNGSSMAHEIGHFFSLIHTHGNGISGTMELVDGSNCDTTGDGLCDTPADPGLSYDNVNEDCNYTGITIDANGDFYAPDTGNVMSYSRKSCRDHFSAQQYARMYAYYLMMKDEIFDEFEVSTTTTEGLESLKIYPNPVTNGQIFIQRDEFLNETLEFEVTNLSGQILFKGYSTKDVINVNQLPSGSYFLTLRNAETKITRRFIK